MPSPGFSLLTLVPLCPVLTTHFPTGMTRTWGLGSTLSVDMSGAF